jgi:AAA domain-containing protein/DNA primase RepB-like protein
MVATSVGGKSVKKVPDFNIAIEFVVDLVEQAKGKGKGKGNIFLASLDHKSKRFRQQCFKIDPDMGSKMDHFIRRETQAGRSVYACPNLFSTEKKVTTSAWPPIFVHSDVDDGDVSKLPGRPYSLIETSVGRYQCLYLLDRPYAVDQVEGLSKALTYAVDGDSGGWSVAKYLRIPGLPNFKPDRNGEIVKEIDTSGHRWKFDDLDQAIRNINGSKPHSDNRSPERFTHDQETLIRQGATLIHKDVSETLKPKISAASMRGILFSPSLEPTADRSRLIWKAIKFLIEKGFPLDEAACLVFNCSAFRSKFNGNVDRLVDEFRRGLEKKAPIKSHSKKTKRKHSDDNPIISLDTVEPEDVSYVWYPYFPKGKLIIVEGDPGTRKTFILLKVIALLSRGLPLPGSKNKLRRKSLFISYEDGVADTLVKRLINMDADLTQIAAPNENYYLGFGDDDERLAFEEHIKTGKFGVVVIDPLNAALSSSNLKNNSAIREVLTWLKELGAKYGCTFIIVRHLAKQKGNSAIGAGSGFMDISAAARSVIRIERIEKDGEEMSTMIHVKSNLAPEGDSWAFDIGSDGDITFEPAPNVSRNTLEDKTPSKRETCKSEILSELRNGAKTTIQLRKALPQFAKATFERARTELSRDGVIEMVSVGRTKRKWTLL